MEGCLTVEELVALVAVGSVFLLFWAPRFLAQRINPHGPYFKSPENPEDRDPLGW